MQKIILVLFTLLFVNHTVYADAGSKTIIDGYASNSDYKVAGVKIINDNDANFTIRGANHLVCVASQMRTDKFVNQAYRGFFDTRICSNMASEFDITVSTRRVNNSTPQETDFWSNDNSEVGHITAYASDDFSIQRKHDNINILEFTTKPDFVAYAYKGTGFLGLDSTHTITEQVIADKKNRSGGLVSINTVATRTNTRIEFVDGTITYAYNDDYLYTNSSTITRGTRTLNNSPQPYIDTRVASQCFSRKASPTIAILYNVYDYDDGSLKTVNTGFHFSYRNNDNAIKYSYINNLGIKQLAPRGYEYPKKIKRLSDGTDLTLSYDSFSFSDNVLSTLTYIGKGSITITDSAGSVTIFHPLELEFAYKKSDAQNPQIDIAEGTYTANIGRIYGNVNEKILYIDVTLILFNNGLVPGITLKDGTLLQDRESGKKYITKAVGYSRFYEKTDANNCTTLVGITSNLSFPDLDNIDTSKTPNIEDKPEARVLDPAIARQ